MRRSVFVAWHNERQNPATGLRVPSASPSLVWPATQDTGIAGSGWNLQGGSTSWADPTSGVLPPTSASQWVNNGALGAGSITPTISITGDPANSLNFRIALHGPYAIQWWQRNADGAVGYSYNTQDAWSPWQNMAGVSAGDMFSVLLAGGPGNVWWRIEFADF